MSFGRYQFLSWARRGVAREIQEKDKLGKSNGVAEVRARIPVSVTLSTGDTEAQNFSLFGPGDVGGIDPKMIIRTDPLNGVSNFEPNLLPYVEFYDEDFPFRYTPASADASGRHQRPWIALVVLKENEFVETDRREPLNSIRIVDETLLPPTGELHLWAHMHSNLPHDESNFERFLDSLEEDAKTDPDGIYSRLICPRKLDPSTLYHAFLVPSYETGRLAGLNQPIDGVKAQTPAWPLAADEMPVYYRWNFRTGQNFDFEYMVRQLKPRVMPKEVGIREMDCSKPAFVRADDNSEVRATNPKVMLLEGALLAPDAERTKFPDPALGNPFLGDIQKLVNLNRLQLENENEDPFVSVPFYGMNHAMRRSASTPGKREIPEFAPFVERWVNELNRDPRNRVPAGFGKRVVQENQEQFADTAWQQLSDVLEANRRMRRMRFAMEAMSRIHNKTLFRMDDELYLAMTVPMSARVRHRAGTARTELENSVLTAASVDPAFSRMTRKKVSLTRTLNRRAGTKQFTYKRMVQKSNLTNGISAEVPELFQPVSKLKNITQFTSPNTASAIKVWSQQSNLDQTYSFNQANFSGGLPSLGQWNQKFPPALFLGNLGGIPGGVIGGVGGVGGVGGGAIGGVVGGVPRPDINLGGVVVGRNPGGTTRPRRDVIGGVGGAVLGGGVAAGGVLAGGVGGVVGSDLIEGGVLVGGGLVLEDHFVDSNIANNTISASAHNAQIKSAYQKINVRTGFDKPVSSRAKVNVAAVADSINAVIEPVTAYDLLSKVVVKWPGNIFAPPQPELFLQAMAYPDIPAPTYQYLLDIDKEFLLPNLDLIPNNTLSLLKTNQRFIESYMVGLNHEMGRELMWREYPTDLRGSYFRQFWDVNGFVTPDTTPTDAESMKDIKPIHLWPNRNRLGQNNAREDDGDAEQLVFVIRGDLLNKYPNTVIFAQKAIDDPDSSDSEKTVIRTGELSDAVYKKEVMFPLYQAVIKPDIKLLGFDLTIDQAIGADTTPGFGNNRDGWYFVIAEVPGEPHFGMDISFSPGEADNLNWNDLSWTNLPANTSFVSGNTQPNLNVVDEPAEWGHSSAHMASILLQRPVMVAIHASEMLNKPVERAIDIGDLITLVQHIRFAES